MIVYKSIVAKIDKLKQEDSEGLLRIAAEDLARLWIRDYSQISPKADILEVAVPVEGADASHKFRYLFDAREQRLLSAWGLSLGKNAEGRDEINKRLRGLTQSAHEAVQRDKGHAIPHILSGGADINIVPQLSKVNRGAFRHLEGLAAKAPGGLYFTYWYYRPVTARTPLAAIQIPYAVDQGLLQPGACEIANFAN